MTLAKKVSISHQVSKVSYFALLILLTLWYLVIAPAQTDHPWVIWLIHFLPLVAFIRIVIRGDARGHAWLCFVLLLYFIGAVFATMMPPTRWLGLAEAILLCVLFTNAMMFARWKSQLDRGLS